MEVVPRSPKGCAAARGLDAPPPPPTRFRASRRRFTQHAQVNQKFRLTVITVSTATMGSLCGRLSATHFLTKRLPKVATEMALNVLAYNIKRVMAIIGVAGLLEALAA